MKSAPRSGTPRGSARAAWLIALALVAVVALLYAQTARHDFVGFDDGSYITRNPHVNSGLSGANLRWAFGAFHSGNWHPLTWLSHQLDVELFGLAPGGHHLENAALHALNAVLCFLFLRRTTATLWASALAALLFAVHPQRVESVAWASERKDVLAGTFFFLTLLAYERYARAPGPRRYVLVLLAFALGLLAKPMLVTLPVVLLLLDRWPLARTTPWRALLLEKLPLFGLALGSAAVTLLAQRAAGAVSTLEQLALAQRLGLAVLGTWAYLAQAFWPSGLAFFYPHPARSAPDAFAPLATPVLLGTLALVALTLAAWRLRRRAPALVVGWAWMLVMFLPVIGLVQVGRQFIADRYAYLPLLGLVLALVYGVGALAPAAARRALFALGVALGAALAAVSFRQVGTWKDDRALCERALAVTTRNDVAHELLGDFFRRQGELERACEQYRATLAIAPQHAAAHNSLGYALLQLGRLEEAEAEFRESLRLAPDALEARLNWGQLRERLQDPEGALGHYRIARAQHPEAPEAWSKLGDACFALARLPEARAAYEEALARTPTADAHARLGLTLAELGETGSARTHLAEALRLAPEQAFALHGEAWLRATSPSSSGERDPARALQALARYGQRSELARWLNLRVAAAALAASGRFADAARTAAEAGALAPAAWWPRLVQERERYSAGRALGD